MTMTGELTSVLISNEYVRSAGRAVTAAGLLALTACGSGVGASEQTNRAGTAATEPSPPARSAAPFKVTRTWELPERVIPSPQLLLGDDDCRDFWLDEDGKRQPEEQGVDEGGLIVRVDGRCNRPRGSEENGVYPTPEQVPGQSSDVVLNGDPLGVECYVPDGQKVQDDRGLGSPVWIGVVTPNGVTGYFPETNAGFVDESRLPVCA